MAEIMSALLLLLTLSLAFAAEPGVKLAVTNKGLDYANQLAEAELRRQLQTLSIADQSGSEGRLSWRLNNVGVKGISGPDTHISLNPGAGGVTLGVSNFGINVHADWRVSYKILFKITASGSVDLGVSGVSVTLVAGLGEKTNGAPSVFAKSCSCSIQDIDVKFHGGLVAWVLNQFKTTVRNKIRNVLQDKVCDTVNKEVNNRIDKELGNMKLNVEIAQRFLLDYSLIRAPTVTDNYIEVATKGTVYWKDNRQESPFTPAVLPALSEFSNMLYVDVTEYSANTLAYVAHANGYLRHDITMDNLPIDVSDLLDPTGQLNDHYPNSTLELRISSSSAPGVKFENQNLTIAAAANVEVVVHTKDGAVTPLSLRVSLSMTVKPSLVNGNLIGNITAYTFNVAVIRSDIGEIDEKDLNKLIRETIDQVVNSGLNEFFKQGIALPVTGIFRLYNTKLNLQTGYLQVATDVGYLS